MSQVPQKRGFLEPSKGLTTNPLFHEEICKTWKVDFWVPQLNINVNPKYPRFILLKRGRVQQFVMTLQEGLIREKKCEMSSFKLRSTEIVGK